MPSKLSALLVQDRVVSFRQMDAAVQRRRKLGGRTGTNLMELGYVDEDVLLYYLSKQRQVPAVERSMFAVVDPAALEAWPYEMAVEHHAAPLGLYDDLLQLAVVDPLPDEFLDAFREHHGLYIEQFITLEFRYWQALHSYYDAEIDDRWTRLIDQYPIPMAIAVPKGEEQVQPVLVAAPRFETGEHGVPALAWSVEELSAFFDETDDRDEMLMAALGFIGKFFRRRMLFVVGRTSLRGYALQMTGEPGGAINAVEIPVVEDQPLARALVGRSYYLGPAGELGLDAVYRGLDIPPAAELATIPIRVGPRPALLLVADNGEETLDTRSVPILFLVANRLSAGLERLIRKHKLRESQAVQALTEDAIRDSRTHRERTGAAPAIADQATSMMAAVEPVARGLHEIPDDGWELPAELSGATTPAPPASRPTTRPTRTSPSGTKPAASRLSTRELAAHQGTRPMPATGDEPAVDAGDEPPVDPSSETPIGDAEDASPVDDHAALHEEGELVETVAAPNDDEATNVVDRDALEDAGEFEEEQTGIYEPAAETRADTETAAEGSTVDPLEVALPRTPSGSTRLIGNKTFGYEARPRATGDMAIVGFRRREEDSGAARAIPSGRNRGPIDLDVRMPGVLQPPRVREPQTDDERAFAQGILDGTADELIEKLTSDDAESSDAAFVELLNRGHHVADALMTAFPGPLVVDRRSSRSVRSPKPLEKHGPIVWLVALQLPKFLDPLRAKLEDEEDDVRYYAARLLFQSGDTASVPEMVERLFDRDDQVRETALRYLEQHLNPSRHAGEMAQIRARLEANETWVVETAISALQQLKDVGSVMTLVDVLDHSSDRTRQKAAQALSRLTYQDHGVNRRRWERWLRKFGDQSRNDWLLSAMVDREWKVRDNAARELRRMPIVVNFNADLDKRARQTAQRAVHHFLFGRTGGP